MKRQRNVLAQERQLVHFSLCQHNAEEVCHILEQTYHIIPPIIPLTSDTPSCRTLLWDTLVGHSRRKLLRGTLLERPMNPLTSDTLRLRQHVSRSPVARRHANALPTKAAQIPMALPHHERTLATRSVHTLEANISHDTANDPAHQRRRVYASMFTPACFALPTISRRHANTLPTKATQIPMALRRHERNFATRSATP